MNTIAVPSNADHTQKCFTQAEQVLAFYCVANSSWRFMCRKLPTLLCSYWIYAKHQLSYTVAPHCSASHVDCSSLCLSQAQLRPSIIVPGVEVRPPCIPLWMRQIQVSTPPTAVVGLKATALPLTLALLTEETIIDRYEL